MNSLLLIFRRVHPAAIHAPPITPVLLPLRIRRGLGMPASGAAFRIFSATSNPLPYGRRGEYHGDPFGQDDGVIGLARANPVTGLANSRAISPMRASWPSRSSPTPTCAWRTPFVLTGTDPSVFVYSCPDGIEQTATGLQYTIRWTGPSSKLL